MVSLQCSFSQRFGIHRVGTVPSQTVVKSKDILSALHKNFYFLYYDLEI